MRKVLTVALALAAASLLSACNTVEGMGKDIKAGGQAIQRAADSNK